MKTKWTATALVAILCGLEARADINFFPERHRKKPGVLLFAQGEVPFDDDLRSKTQLRPESEHHSDVELMRARNVADYLGLRAVSEVHLPVPLNFVFIGFDGDGAMGMKLPPQELKEWFEHLDHIQPHVRVPLDTLTCIETGHCSSTTLAKRPEHTRSHVHYNYSCHVVSVDRDVSATFAQAVQTFSRPLDPGAPARGWQVDAEAFEEFVGYFLQEMGLAESNTLLILNPDVDAEHKRYSYTSGLSQAEVSLLLDNAKQSRDRLRRISRGPARPGGPPSPQKPWFGRPRGKFLVVDNKRSGGLWVQSARERLQAYVAQRKAERVHAGSGPAHEVLTHLVWKLTHGTAEQAARVDDFLAQTALNVSLPPRGRIGVKLPYESCQVDAWVGAGRWAMLDLSAEASDWGPWVGGDGIKTRHGKPSVAEAFDPTLSKARTNERRDGRAEMLLREQYRVMIEHRLAALHNSHAAAVHAAHVHEVAPGLEKPDIDVKPPELSLRRAELDVLEHFAKRHCQGAAPALKLCGELQAKAHLLMRDISQLLDDPHSVQQDLDRTHGWDIFGSGHEVDGVFDVNDDSEAGEARQLFKAQLGALASSAMRHVITPPTASWNNSALHTDTASNFAQQVLFSVYLIDEAKRASPATAARDFNVDALKAEVERLRLPFQTFRWAVHSVAAATEPALSNAIQVSLRTALGGDAAHPTRRTTYIDSAALAAQLRAHLLQSQGSQSTTRGMVEIPVMVLMMQRPDALFVDQHYFARTLPDMVLLVHNKQSHGMHPMGVTCGGALVARKLSSTTAAAAAAVAQALGGLLPSHLGYSPLHDQVLHRWQWSVGQNPFSLTSQAPAFSRLQIDALWRSYLVDALDLSLHRVNTGVRLLESTRTSISMLPAFAEPHTAKAVKQLLSAYSVLGNLWSNIMLAVDTMDYTTAAQGIPVLRTASEEFLAQAVLLEDLLRMPSCSSSVLEFDIEVLLPSDAAKLAVVGGCAAAAALLAWLSARRLRRRKPKAKFN